MDLTQSDDDDNGDIDSNGGGDGSTIDLTMSDSEDEDEAQTPQAQTPQKVEPPEEGESPEQRRADADMNILLSIGASIGARADDVRSMRMTDIGTSMVAGLGKSASLEGSECMTLVVNDGKITGLVVNDGKITGSSRKRVRRFFATHNNPAQDFGAALVRRNAMLETVPHLADLKANFDTYGGV